MFVKTYSFFNVHCMFVKIYSFFNVYCVPTCCMFALQSRFIHKNQAQFSKYKED